MHRRYLQQAQWTAELRRHLFERTAFSSAKRVLEVGSGTGAVLGQLAAPEGQKIHGLDSHIPSLRFARQQNISAELAGGDAHSLPYADKSFDLVYCHFVLLWLTDPLAALKEMKRVAKPGSALLAFAEPDYGGRIDHPPELKPLGKWQAEALSAQGADPEMGRKLVGLFHDAGLLEVESGVLGAQWASPKADNVELEWQLLRADLEGRISSEQLTLLEENAQIARQSGEGVLYVPTFYAWGRVG